MCFEIEVVAVITSGPVRLTARGNEASETLGIDTSQMRLQTCKIAQFQYIKSQSYTIGIISRLRGVNPYKSFILVP